MDVLKLNVAETRGMRRVARVARRAVVEIIS